MSTTASSTVSLMTRYPHLMHLYGRFIPNFLLFDRVVTPLWYILGLFGNTLSAYVWLNPEVRRNNSSAVYLAALSIWDLVFLVLHTFQELREAWNIAIENVVMCFVLPVVLLTAQYLSPILVLGFTVERWISICFPFKRESLCSTRRAYLVIGFMTAGVAVWNLAQLNFKAFEQDACVIRSDGWLWLVYTLTTEIVISGLVPVTALVFNLLVIHEMYKIAVNRGATSRNRQLCSEGGGGNLATAVGEDSSGDGRFMSSTIMLLSVSFFVILTSLPAGLIYGLQTFAGFGSQNLTDAEVLLDPAWRRHFAMARVKKVIDEISISHYSLNFLIYLATGAQYRRHVLLLFARTSGGCASSSSASATAAAASVETGSGAGNGKRRKTEEFYLNNSRTNRATRRAAASSEGGSSCAANRAAGLTAGDSGEGNGKTAEKPLLATYI